MDFNRFSVANAICDVCFRQGGRIAYTLDIVFRAACLFVLFLRSDAHVSDYDAVYICFCVVRRIYTFVRIHSI